MASGGIGRKRSELGGSPAGASEILRQVGTLFSGFNRNKNKSPDDYEDGMEGSPEPVLSLQVDDSELIALSSQWKREYDEYYDKVKDRQDNNYKYWKGEQYASKATDQRGVDNVIFESVETLLPIVSRQNPEPSVSAEQTDDGMFVADCTAKILEAKADETRLKSKIKLSARHWSLYFLGCFKMGWDTDVDDMYFQVINPQRLVLDPKGTFDGAEFKGKYIGEYKTATAEDLAKTFPEHADAIREYVDGKMGSSLGYHEWWTNEYVFWRFRDLILDKRQNPYWNGSEEKTSMDEYGQTVVDSVDGVNHFATPKMPYSFLSVFNTGKQPHDETSLVEQCLSLQDIVNKRLKQIDKNADDTNNGWVFSNQFDQDQAKNALNALRNGGAIIAATESIQDSVQRFPAPALANFVYQDMEDKRQQVYNIMGVRGSTAQGVLNENTVRGKIEIKGQDVDRLALVIEQVEQFVDHLYNLATQTIYVYYDESKAARSLGPEKAARYMALLKAGPSRRLVVSVKEGSTIPQDPLLRRNEAIDLWGAGALDPETLFERLNFPDPKEMAAKLFAFKAGQPPEGVAPPAPQVQPAPEQAGQVLNLQQPGMSIPPI
jgi:hypothetical protein